MDYSLKVWFVKIIFVIFSQEQAAQAGVGQGQGSGPSGQFEAAQGAVPDPIQAQASSAVIIAYVAVALICVGLAWMGIKVLARFLRIYLAQEEVDSGNDLSDFYFLIFHYSVPCSIFIFLLLSRFRLYFLFLLLLVQFIIAACVTILILC